MSDPLANKLRPTVLDDVVGQRHLLGEGKPLRKIIETGVIPNMVFYGPSGVGKTTVASIIAKCTNKALRRLNATTASTADIKEIVSQIDTLETMNGILLYLDEIQYFNKKQQQVLLEYIENGSITLIAATTENPYFYVYNAILSRSTVFEFKSVSSKEIEAAVSRAFKICEKEQQITLDIEDGVIPYIATACGGDVRKAINSVELCVLTAKQEYGDNYIVELDAAKQLTQKSSMRYDRNGDEHYDILSAFQKSMRGSDSDAAIHYLARLLEADDLASACRRLIVCACEDVGLAYPQIIPIVKACVDCALQIGLPEARIPLADAVIMVCNAPKSNSAYLAIDRAAADIKAGKIGSIPRNLQNKHFDGDDASVKGQFYIYPHDYPNHYTYQQYLPDELKNVHYYEYGNNKTEQAYKAYWDKIKGK